MTKKKPEPVEEEFFATTLYREKPKPFWKKKRFLFPVIGALLSGVFGVKNPEVFVEMGANIYKNIQGHSTD